MIRDSAIKNSKIFNLCNEASVGQHKGNVPLAKLKGILAKLKGVRFSSNRAANLS